MEQVREVILSDATVEQKHAALEQFNQENQQSTTFIEGEDAENKRELISALLCLLATTDSYSVSYSILNAIRLMCREAAGLEPLQEDQHLKTIVAKTYLQSDLTNRETDFVQCATEACKCLVNIAVQNVSLPELYDKFHEQLNLTELCCKALEKEDISERFYFPVMRLLLQLAGRHEQSGNYTKSQNLLPRLLGIVENLSDRYGDQELYLTLIDTLSMIFVVSQHLGPLDEKKEPTEEELEAFKRVIPIFQRFLALPKDDPKTLKLVSSTIKCMINVPGQCTDDFDHHKTLNALLEFAAIQLSKPEDELAAHELTPVLLILTSISKAIRESHDLIKDALLPGWREFEPTNNLVDPPEPLKDPNSMGNKLLYCMTSSNPGLYHYSSELIFSLCDEDADEFVRIVGIGKGAGILANRGLLGGFASKMKRPERPTNVSEEDIAEWERLMDRLAKHNSGQN